MERRAYIPQETARRLSLYLRMLRRLRQEKVRIVSSDQIRRFLNVSSVQFRKDLSYFGEFGKRGVGYDVELLAKEIGKILGTDVLHEIILVGVGRLGSALLEYPGFLEFNLKISEAFDRNTRKVGKVCGGVRIRHMRALRQVIKKRNLRIAVLSVPVEFAQEVAEELVSCGIKAILNFAPVNLVLEGDVFVSNADMASELESLVYKLKQKNNNYSLTKKRSIVI
ncbi:MAG: redox-sensing transcriptional repressor Rex [Candidatus Omnitrophica bacterium]|nr:redox-sensing transcriptional repressor Rex [Candidatus Omnitrophota bacterium]